MSKGLAGYMQFVWAGVIKQVQMGAILPSQRFLIEKMIAPIPETYRGQVVERSRSQAPSRQALTDLLPATMCGHAHRRVPARVKVHP